MKLSKLLVLACVFCLSATVFGQKFLEKPYQEWSADDAAKMVSGLPWANQYQSSNTLTNLSIVQQAREQNDTRLGGQERGSTARTVNVLPITIRLHSALPVRQALVRLKQIQAGYDKMNTDQKKKFDESTSILLNCAICTDYYVVTLLKAKNSSMEVQEDAVFQGKTLEELKGKIWLQTDKGERRELAQFNPPKGPGDMAVFFFKRTDDGGRALITPETKEFKFVFAKELHDPEKSRDWHLLPEFFDFKVSKILINGKVEF